MSKPLILLVDSDTSDRNPILTLLNDYDVTVVGTGLEAIHYFEKHHLKIRLVLLRIVLPDMLGLDVFREMRAKSHLQEIIVLSASKDIRLAVSAMKEGAFDFIIMPGSDDLLMQSVSQAIDSLDYSERLYDFVENTESKGVFIHEKMDTVDSVVHYFSSEGIMLTAEQILGFYPDVVALESMSLPVLRDHVASFLNLDDGQYKKEKVLVVEDEAIYRSMILGFLKQKYEVFEAADAAEALGILNNNRDIRVILCDVSLPDVLGSELIPELVTLAPTVEIIVVTALEMIDKTVKVFQGGATDFLNKPVLKADILDAVTRALRRYYQKHIISDFRQLFMAFKLTDQTKLALLDKLVSDRKDEGDLLRMEDIYVFFPELRETHIPSGVALPENIQENLPQFIQDLQLRPAAEEKSVSRVK